MPVQKSVSILFITMLAASTFAQSIIVDMDTASGIQSTATSGDTGLLLTIQIRATGAVNLFSYQYKVAFDTSRLTYMGAQPDGGILGEKNILNRSGGVPIGVNQLQLNPPASDTIEMSGTITGTDPTKSVSGSGLIGVMYFKSKIAIGDSITLTACSGFTATFGGELTPVTAYTPGKYRVIPPVSTTPRRAIATTAIPRQDRRTVIVTIGTSESTFEISATAAAATPTTFRLFTPVGRLIMVCPLRLTNPAQKHSIAVQPPAAELTAGLYIGSIDINGARSTTTFRF